MSIWTVSKTFLCIFTAIISTITITKSLKASSISWTPKKSLALIFLTGPPTLIYYLKNKNTQKNKQKSTLASIFLNLLTRNKLFDTFKLYQFTTSEHDAENLRKEAKDRFEVESLSPIHLNTSGNKVAIPSEFRENYKINGEGKISIFLGWNFEDFALDYLKNKILLSNEKPGVIISFYEDSQEFRKEEEHSLLLIQANFDFKHYGLIIEEIKNWLRKLKLKNLQGLTNIGNTCYMNSLIQVFSVMPRIDLAIKSINSPIFWSLAQIILALKRRDKFFDYRRYLQEFQSKIIEKFNMFTAYDQHDTKELYNVLIDEIVSKFEEGKGIFTIIINKCFSCKENHRPVFKEESQLFLVIPGNSFGNIKDHIKKDHYFYGKNQLWCETCQEMRDTKLTVDHIEWPLNLAIYISGNGLTSNLKDQISLDNQVYNLYAVICHSGGNSFGHYWAHLLIDGKWIECNDSFVRENSPRLSNCYMLFYSKELIKLYP